MTVISRRQYDHPVLGAAGGSGLHASIQTLYLVLGNDSQSRYVSYSAVANSAVNSYAHNFGVTFAELNIAIYTGTYPNLILVADPVAAGYTIVGTPGNLKTSLDVTAPSSGGPHTFNLLIQHGQPASSTMPGAVSTGAQTFAGAKTFSSTIVGSISGNAATVTTNANLTGEVTSVGNAATLLNSAVIGKVLTGYASGAGTVAATDTILQAFQKINGNDALKAPLASPTFTGVISNALGAVGTPSYAFTGDLDTGMWSSAANTLSFSTAGVKVAEASSAGAWTFGPSSASPAHIFNTGSTVTQTYVNGQIILCNADGAAATPAITGTSTTANKSGLYFSTGTNDSNTASDMVFNVRTSGNAEFTTFTNKAFAWSRFGTEIGSATRAGAWTFGPSGFTGMHTLRGTVQHGGTGTSSTVYWVQTGGTTSSDIIIDARTGTNASALQVKGDTSIAFANGSVSSTGVWEFGGGSTTATVKIIGGGGVSGSNYKLGISGASNTAATVAAIQLGDNVSGASKQWAVTNGRNATSQTVGQLNFVVSNAVNTDALNGSGINAGSVTDTAAWFFGNPSAAAQGITLQGNDAGYTATALKYYQQGTFNPSINFGGGNGTRTYSSTGYYTRIGNLCHFQAFISAIVVGTASGGASINLPFASANSSNLYGTCVIGLTNGVSVISQGNINPNDTNCALLKADGVTGVATTDFGGSSYFTITISYLIA